MCSLPNTDYPLDRESSKRKQQQIIDYILSADSAVANRKYYQKYISCIVLAVVASVSLKNVHF